MEERLNLDAIKPDRVFSGGELDCGSGLILLLRENMIKVPEGGILEMQSCEPTVGDDLPPWCRMVGHTYLGALEGQGCIRYFIRRETAFEDEKKELEADKEKAKSYEWRVRARYSGNLQSRVYCRNFSIDIGQPASFEEKDKHPSAVEFLLAALAGDLATGFASDCVRNGLEVDDIEMTVKGRLENILVHLGLQEGYPGFSSIEIKCFASTFDEESKVREAWRRTVEFSPLASTLKKAVELQLKLAIV